MVKLADFGISILVAEPSPVAEPPAAAALDGERAARLETAVTEQPMPAGDLLRRQLTQTGNIIGTPLYMAPELYQGSRNAQPSADLFSFGVLAFEVLTGELPFSRPAILVRALQVEVKAPSLGSARPDLPPAVAALISRCLSSEPSQRPSAEQVAAELAAYG